MINISNSGNIHYSSPWWVKEWSSNSAGQTISTNLIAFIEGNFDISVSISPKYENASITSYNTNEGKIVLCLWNASNDDYIKILGGDSNSGRIYPRDGGYAGWTDNSSFPLSSYNDVVTNINYLTGEVLNNTNGWINNITLKNGEGHNNFTSAQYNMTNPLYI